MCKLTELLKFRLEQCREKRRRLLTRRNESIVRNISIMTLEDLANKVADYDERIEKLSTLEIHLKKIIDTIERQEKKR